MSGGRRTSRKSVSGGTTTGLGVGVAVTVGVAGSVGVAEQHLVEAGARHLVGPRHRGLDRGGEVDVGGGCAVDLREARAPLLDEAGRADGFVDAELPEDLVGPGKLRLADVEAREHVAFQHQHAPARPRQRGRHARACRPSADDGDVVVPALCLDTHRADLARGRMQAQTEARRRIYPWGGRARRRLTACGDLRRADARPPGEPGGPLACRMPSAASRCA